MKKILIMLFVIVTNITIAQEKNDVIEEILSLPRTDKTIKYNGTDGTITQISYFPNQKVLILKFEIYNDGIHQLVLNNIIITEKGLFCDQTQKFCIRFLSKETQLWILFKIESLLKKNNIY